MLREVTEMYAKVAGGILAYVASMVILAMACLYDLNSGLATQLQPQIGQTVAAQGQ
jgi:hypothetical protein